VKNRSKINRPTEPQCAAFDLASKPGMMLFRHVARHVASQHVLGDVLPDIVAVEHSI